jgi:ADP-dependent phosphofructokinase/glucokinase
MVTIQLDKPRQVRLTAGAFKRFQASVTAGKGDVEDIGDLIHDCLKPDVPSLTTEALEDLLDVDAMRTVWAAVQAEIDAFGAALNPTKASEAPASTGGENAPSPALN